MQSVHSVNYNSVFSGSGDSSDDNSPNMMIIKLIIFDFTSILKILAVCQALSAQAMVQGLLALKKERAILFKTRAGELFTVYSQTDIPYTVPNILSQLHVYLEPKGDMINDKKPPNI